jgi:OOP family OmpA-OmpF porin
MIFNNLYKTTLICSTLILATACASTPGIQDFPATASAREEFTKLTADLNKADREQYEVLAPTNFRKSQEAYDDAKLSLDKQKDDKATLHAIAESRAYLGRANQTVKQVSEILPDVVVARQQAVDAGARSTLSVEMKKADSQLKDMTSDIEKNETKEAISERSAMQTTYLDLELQSIKRAKLSAPRNTLAAAVKEGAGKLAPRSLAIAEKSIQDADSFITGNRHETEQIANFTAKSQKSAEHVLKITRDAKSGKHVSAEDMALRVEDGENKVTARDGQLKVKQAQINEKSAELEVKDNEIAETGAENHALAAENLETQAALARNEGANVALTAANTAQAGEIAKGAAENQALAANNSDMQAEQAMNQRFETARKQFTKQEAEVYKQGNTLTIRLRGLEFPASQAVLKGSNFPLLAKVQRVIADFGSSSVVVEGHTDSTGNKANNEKLSTERAQAVSTYLSSNLGNQKVNIEAVGFGDQKPLASNKTSSGRAQNRRVDVLIHQGPAKAL